MSGLLVSVRDADEADAAVAGGAGLIDVKEPSRGPLGRADDAVICAVVERVAGRRPVSAALGEALGRRPALGPWAGRLAYVKQGPAGLGRKSWWPNLLAPRVKPHLDWFAGARFVVTAYADWAAADAPPVEELCAFARERRGGAFLIDTYTKAAGPDGRRPTLLDFLPARRVMLFSRLCRAAGVRVALAGSLGPAEIEQLLPAAPDWFAVRGAACGGGDRGGRIDEGRVRILAALAARAVG